MNTISKIRVANIVENHVTLEDPRRAPKRGLVFLSRSGKTAYGVDVTVRNTDMQSILKTVLKLVLGEERVRTERNKVLKEDAIVKETGREVGASDLKTALGCIAVAVTDRFGNIIEDSWVMPLSGKSLKAEVMPKKSGNLYYAAVQKTWAGVPSEEIPWNDLYLSTMLNAEVRGIMMAWDYCECLDRMVKSVDASNREVYANNLAAEREKVHAQNAVKAQEESVVVA